MCHLDEKNSPLWIDTIIVWSSFEFQQKVDIVWNYQVKSRKLQTPGIDFFNPFIVTNWRLCVSIYLHW